MTSTEDTRMGETPFTEPTIADLPITDDEIFLAHAGGKLSVELRAPIDTQRDLSIAYTPGVAQVSRAIAEGDIAAANFLVAEKYVDAVRALATAPNQRVVVVPIEAAMTNATAARPNALMGCASRTRPASIAIAGSRLSRMLKTCRGSRRSAESSRV